MCSSDLTRAPPEMLHVPGQYSGGETKEYTWTQTKSELEVRIPLPDVPEGSVKCDILPRSFMLTFGNTPGVALGGELSAVVVMDDSVWSVERDGVKAVAIISLRKAIPELWTRLLATDAEPEAAPQLLDGLERKKPMSRQELLRQVCTARMMGA